MNKPPFESFKGPICKGSYALGSACGKCERCKWEREQMQGVQERKPQCVEFAPLAFPNESGQGMRRLACVKEAHSEDELHETAEHSFMGYTVKLSWKSPKVGRGAGTGTSTPA